MKKHTNPQLICSVHCILVKFKLFNYQTKIEGVEISEIRFSITLNTKFVFKETGDVILWRNMFNSQLYSI